MMHSLQNVFKHSPGELMYYSFSKSTEIAGKTTYEVLDDETIEPDCRPKPNMYIGPRGVPRCFIDGKEYIPKKEGKKADNKDKDVNSNQS